jgi:uncharacterized membrane protein
VLVGILALLIAIPTAAAQSGQPVVHVVMFYSPTCPHCHKVISEDLPPLIETYGEQLQILYIDISQGGGQAAFETVTEQFGIPPQHRGVPLMVVGDDVLIGGLEIPERLPGLIEEHLAQGGLAWPDIPGLQAVVDQAEQQATAATEESAAQPAEEPVTEATPAAAANRPAAPDVPASPGDGTQLPSVTNEQPASLSIGERFALDPAGNGLAVAVLLGMVLVVGYSVATFTRPTPGMSAPAQWQVWAVPLLCLVGAGVAGYLAFVETTQTQAVCGPVGDCNTVQQSEYAQLFGIPIGVLGVVGYTLMLLVWLVARSGKPQVADRAWLALLVMTMGGTLFSIYLTFLEPFVIGASCAWCLTSAVIMTLLFWLSLAPGKRALERVFRANLNQATG